MESPVWKAYGNAARGRGPKEKGPARTPALADESAAYQVTRTPICTRRLSVPSLRREVVYRGLGEALGLEDLTRNN
ncbi:MAG: hypothetical protein ACRD2H_04125 [Terriglobales bacterium]